MANCSYFTLVIGVIHPVTTGRGLTLWDSLPFHHLNSRCKKKVAIFSAHPSIHPSTTPRSTFMWILEELQAIKHLPEAIIISSKRCTYWLGGNIPSRELTHIPPNGKFGKSSAQKMPFFGDMLVSWRVMMWFDSISSKCWFLQNVTYPKIYINNILPIQQKIPIYIKIWCLQWVPFTLKLTTSWHLKIDVWKMILSFWRQAYFQGRTVSFGDGTTRRRNLSNPHIYGPPNPQERISKG